MANALYGLGRQAFLSGDADWLGDDIRVLLVDLADYTPLIDTDEFLSDVPAPARVHVSTALLSKTAALGVANAAGITLVSVTGDPSEALVLYQHTGVDATSRLLVFMDNATGLPITPDGNNIVIVWNAGATKIFKL